MSNTHRPTNSAAATRGPSPSASPARPPPLSAQDARARADAESRAVNALINDRQFAPGDPDRTTTARRIVRIVLAAAE